jgi:hypothetical protein
MYESHYIIFKPIYLCTHVCLIFRSDSGKQYFYDSQFYLVVGQFAITRPLPLFILPGHSNMTYLLLFPPLSRTTMVVCTMGELPFEADFPVNQTHFSTAQFPAIDFVRMGD